MSDTEPAVTQAETPSANIALSGISSYVLVVYDEEYMKEVDCASIEDVLARIEPERINWITLRDVHDEAGILKLLSYFNIDPFVMNEIMDERPMQFDIEYENCLYLEYVVPHYLTDSRTVVPSKGAFVLGRNFVILYEHDIHRLFTRTRKRLVSRQTKAHRYGADYLLYLLLRAAIVEHYQLSFKQLTIKLEAVEDRVLAGNGSEEGFQEVLAVREEVKPWNEPLLELQDFLEFVKDAESKFISSDNAHYFTKELNREIEGLIEYYDRLHMWLKEVMDLHMASLTRSSNRIIQILTVVSSIFLPLTFISSIYGMNFTHMPELNHPLGYVIVLLVMAAVGLGSLWFMKRRKWF